MLQLVISNYLLMLGREFESRCSHTKWNFSSRKKKTCPTSMCMYVCMYGYHIQQSMDQPGKVANPARGQLNRENNIPLSPCVPENLVSRYGFSRPVPRQSAHLHTQAESGAYLRDSSRVPLRRPFMKPPYAIGSVSPEFIGSRNCVPMAFTAESPPAQGQ